MQVKMERVPSIPQSLFIPIQFLKQQNKVMCALLEPSAEQLINPRDIHPPLYHDLVLVRHPGLDINVCVCLFEFTNIQIHPSTTKHRVKSAFNFVFS